MQSLTFKFNKKLYSLEKLTDFYFQIKSEELPLGLIVICDLDDVWLKKVNDSKFCSFCFEGWYSGKKKGKIFLKKDAPKTLNDRQWQDKVDDVFFNRVSFFTNNFSDDSGKWEIWPLKSKDSLQKVVAIPYDLCDKCHRRNFIRSDGPKELKFFEEEGNCLFESFKNKLGFSEFDAKEDLHRLKDFLLKEAVGLVSYFNTFQESGLPKGFLKDLHLSTLLTELPSYKDGPRSILCGGEDKNKEISQIKAIMEFIERYALMNIVFDSSILCRREGDGFEKFNYCALEQFVGHFKEELVSSKFLKTFSNHQVWGVDILAKEKVLLPLQALFNTKYFLKKYGTALSGYIPPTSSNGFAAHFDENKALEKSVLELIERDAFVRWWMKPEEVVAIKPEGEVELELNRVVGGLQEILGKKNLEVRLLKLPSPLSLPSVFAFITSPEDGLPALLVGASAGFDVCSASIKAISELEIAALNFIARFQKDPNWVEKGVDLENFKDIKNSSDHIYFYHHPEVLSKLNFLDKVLNLKPQVLDDAQSIKNVGQLKEEMIRQKMHWYAIDATPKVFEKFGAFVARSFVPELYPLYFGSAFPFKTDDLSSLSVAENLPHCFP